MLQSQMGHFVESPLKQSSGSRGGQSERDKPFLEAERLLQQDAEAETQ
jgi:hypothetical protein